MLRTCLMETNPLVARQHMHTRMTHFLLNRHYTKVHKLKIIVLAKITVHHRLALIPTPWCIKVKRRSISVPWCAWAATNEHKRQTDNMIVVYLSVCPLDGVWQTERRICTVCNITMNWSHWSLTCWDKSTANNIEQKSEMNAQWIERRSSSWMAAVTSRTPRVRILHTTHVATVCSSCNIILTISWRRTSICYSSNCGSRQCHGSACCLPSLGQYTGWPKK